MTVLSFAKVYRAWGVEAATEWPMLEFVHSVTGERLAVSYEPIQTIRYQPGDTITLVHYHYAVTLEGKNLLALFEALQAWEPRTIWTFSAAAFEPPASGEPLVERMTIADRQPSATERAWVRQWVASQDDHP